jgi:integrase
MRIRLNPQKINSLRATDGRRRQDYWDSLCPGLGVRVTDKGTRTYVFGARFDGKNFTRREIADVRAIDLADARKKARHWAELVDAGKDPKREEERLARAAAREQESTFGCVAAAFGDDWLAGKRKHKVYVRQIEREFIPRWGKRPIADIERGEVIDLIKAKAVKDRAPAEARNLLGLIKSLLGWALDHGLVDRNVTADIRPLRIIGRKLSRDRALTVAELRALWMAASGLGYPVGTVFQMLVLSATRLNEVARAIWSEFDLDNRVWTIPAARMKGARPHVVPLSSAMVSILRSLPRFPQGNFVFTTTSGQRPVSVGSKIKQQLDTTLGFSEGWRFHDIRRGCRSAFAEIGIGTETAEAILSHVRPGIVGTYDKYSYIKEKAAALEQWAGFIVPPTPKSFDEHRRRRDAAHAR